MEILVKGRNFTWRNMQAAPLLDILDWFFLLEPYGQFHMPTLYLSLCTKQHMITSLVLFEFVQAFPNQMSSDFKIVGQSTMTSK
jgi:hypothetical protein